LGLCSLWWEHVFQHPQLLGACLVLSGSLAGVLWRCTRSGGFDDRGVLACV
jgi:hypothetical protein